MIKNERVFFHFNLLKEQIGSHFISRQVAFLDTVVKLLPLLQLPDYVAARLCFARANAAQAYRGGKQKSVISYRRFFRLCPSSANTGYVLGVIKNAGDGELLQAISK